jgi:hypothetical protein
MVGDLDGLGRLAWRLRVEADEVGALARRVAATAAVPWCSPAADLFREQVHRRGVALGGVAGQLREAADLVDLHAGAVDSAVHRAAEAVDHLSRAVLDPWAGRLPDREGRHA